jgi:hypothetical protein
MPKKPTLDDFIAKKKKVPSKNKRYPGDSDVKIGPSKGKPIIKIKKSKPYDDNAKPVISPKVIEKIIKDSKTKAKLKTKSNKAPKTNWVTKIGSK